MNQGGFVKTLHRHRQHHDRLADRFLRIIPQSLIDRHRKEWPPPFANTSQPVAGNDLRRSIRRADQPIKRRRLKPRRHFVLQRMQVQSARLVVTRQMQVLPHPINVHIGIDTVVLQQGHGNGRNRRRFHIREGPLQNRQTGNAHNGLDLAGLDQRHHNRAAFSHQHRVTESLGFILKILNGAKPALFAKQAEFIKGRGAFTFDPQAFRHEQQTSFERDGGQRFAPHFVVQKYGCIVQINGIISGGGDDFFSMDAQFRERHGWHKWFLHKELTNMRQQSVPLFFCLRDVFLGRAKTCRRHRHRGWELDRLNRQ